MWRGSLTVECKAHNLAMEVQFLPPQFNFERKKMKKPIFIPKGRAREYSPLAMNIWNGCDHGCTYCFNNRDGREFSDKPKPLPSLIERLKAQLSVDRIGKQVFLTFSGDPYCHAEMDKEVTKSVLETLHAWNVPVAILTKGGHRCLRDIDLFKKFNNIKVGATIVFIDEDNRKNWEPNATTFKERIEVLEILHNKGIQTWLSLEPVIDPEQTYEIIRETFKFVDGYRVGKLNYHPEADAVDWKKFTYEVTILLRSLENLFYIKNDLAKSVPKDFFNHDERNSDAMALHVL